MNFRHLLSCDTIVLCFKQIFPHYTILQKKAEVARGGFEARDLEISNM